MDAYSNQPHFRALFEKINASDNHIATFGELSKSIFSGITPKAKGDAYVEPPQGVRFLRSGEITEDGGVLPESEIHISQSIHDGLMRRSQLHRGDLLIAIVGATIGASGVYEYDAPANINQAIAAVRFHDPHILLDYARWYLHSSLGQAILDYLKRPVARANINLEEIGEIPLIIPSLDRQRALVREMEAARESGRRKLAEADALLSGLDAFLLDRLGLTVPEDQENKAFAVRLAGLRGRRMDALAYKPFFAKGRQPKTPVQPLFSLAEIDPPTGEKPFDETSLVPYVGLPECDLTEIRRVAMRPYSEVKGRGAFTAGDILFARIEPSVFNKKYVLAEDLKGHDFAFTSTEFYVVRPRKDMSRYFLYSMFFCSFVFAQARGKTTGSSGRRRLDPELFANLMIPVPSKAMQDEIAKEVTRRRLEARRLREEAGREWEAAKARFEAKVLGKTNP